MSRITFPVILTVAYFCVYVQCSFDGLRNLVGAQFDLLPVLMVFAGLRIRIEAIAFLAVFAGLMTDSLSANPPGQSILPLFAIGLIVHEYQHNILRDDVYAQATLGAAAAFAFQTGSLCLLILIGEQPLLGTGTLWYLVFNTLMGALIAPVVFWLFGKLDTHLNYQPVDETAIRFNRQIKRGRN